MCGGLVVVVGIAMLVVVVVVVHCFGLLEAAAVLHEILFGLQAFDHRAHFLLSFQPLLKFAVLPFPRLGHFLCACGGPKTIAMDHSSVI